jgi:hypothetical protein
MKRQPSPGDLGSVFGDMALLLDRYRKENDVLRAMLREQGLKRQQIRGEVRRRLAYLDSFEEAFVPISKVCRRMLDVLDRDDAAEMLAKMPKGKYVQ